MQPDVIDFEYIAPSAIVYRRKGDTMKVFKTKWFTKWAAKEKLSDTSLLKAVGEMERGLIDANLGGHVVKKRVAIQGRGKRGGVRTLVAYQVEDKAFFMYGFAKNKRANIRDDELRVLQTVADTLLNHDDEMLEHLMEIKELIEVLDNE